MAFLYGLIFLFASSFMPVHAYPASVTGYMYARSASGWDPHSSPQAACDAVLASYMGVNPGSSEGRTYSVTESGCSFSFKYANATHTYGAAIYKIPKYSCPNGGTLTGSECVEAPPDPCEDLADACSGSEGKLKRFSMPGYKVGMSIVCQPATDVSGTIAMFPNCNKGCMGVVSGSNEFNRKADGKWVTFGSAKGNGSTCDPAIIDDLNAEKDPTYEPQEEPKLAETPDATCMNGQKGTIGGVTVCLPFSASSGVTETETKDNGDGTKTNSKTEVKCENGKCEVTKTSTTTNNTTNNTVSSSSTTTTVDKADYCSKNKAAGVCKDEKGEEEGKGTFGGSCQAGFTCKGDAAMCAMAKEQHKRNCEMLQEDKDPGSFINKAKNGTDGESAKAMQENASEINIPTQLNKSGYGWPRSCPANTRIELGFVNASFEIPFDKLCGPLKIFSDIALAITALSLLVWLVFAGREKAGS